MRYIVLERECLTCVQVCGVRGHMYVGGHVCRGTVGCCCWLAEPF